jgi:hypothetical protein
MSVLDAGELAAVCAFAEARIEPTPGLIDAWRQVHYAAQVASEVGKAWAAPQPDDSHSSFTWQDGRLVGAWVQAPRRFRAALGAADLELSLVDEGGRALARRGLDGTTLPEAMAWVRSAAERASGEGPRQAALPAPDLPPHPVAEGARFSAGGRAAEDVARLLAGADAVLRATARALGGGDVRCWPHHFDIATLVALGERAGEPVKTLGVGLAVPDALEASGYWYVSPWARDATPGRSWPPLRHGRWIDRGGPLLMAALSLDSLAALPGGPARPAALASFLADAIGACIDALRPNA